MNDTGGRSTRRWWRPRFGLRTFFILVTVLGVGLGYLGILQQRVQRQRRIVKAIEKIGGKLRYEHQFPPWAKRDDFLAWGDVISHEETKDGRLKVTRTYQGTKTLFEEKPPGPWMIRRLLGEDAFAYGYSADLKWSFDGQGSTDFDPVLLTQLPRLEFLRLSDGQVNDEWLRVASGAPKLRELGLLGRKEGSATAEGLGYLRSASGLKGLSLYGDWLHDDTLTSLGALRGLNWLELFETPNLTGEVLKHVSQLRELECLVIARAVGVDDRKAEHLRKLQKLRKIDFRQTAITDATVTQLGSLKELEWIDLAGSAACDKGAEAIASLPKLKFLKLTMTHVGDKGVEAISQLKELQYLDLRGSRVTDAGLVAIGRMTELQHLELSPLEVTDEGIRQLKGLTKLKELSFGPRISKKAADELRAALPECKVN